MHSNYNISLFTMQDLQQNNYQVAFLYLRLFGGGIFGNVGDRSEASVFVQQFSGYHKTIGFGGV